MTGVQTCALPIYETMHSVGKIEETVGGLIEELGTGGFMSLEDIRPGMWVSVVTRRDSDKEYKAKILEVTDQYLMAGKLTAMGEVLEIQKGQQYSLFIVVDNMLYKWENAELSMTRDERVKIRISGAPIVHNRRKYPRMPLDNLCEVKLASTTTVYDARMVNLSANGFAIATRSPEIGHAKGRDINIRIKGFALLEGVDLNGYVIRVSENAGEYILGCRMPEDYPEIRDYVKANYHGR